MKRQFLKLLLFAFIPALFGTGNVAFSQTWNGSVNSDWNNPSNWNGGVPGSGANVSIPGNASNFPIITTSVTIQQITIGNWSSIATLTVNSGGSIEITNQLTFNGGGQLHIDGGDVNLSGSSFNMAYNANILVEMTSGSFTSHGNVTIIGGNNSTIPGFSALSGEIFIDGDFIIESNKMFEAGNVEISVSGLFKNKGEFSIENGQMLVSGNFENESDLENENADIEVGGNFFVQSNDELNIEYGDLTVHGTTEINGTLNIGDGTVHFLNTAEVRDGGVLNLSTGQIIFHANAYIRSNGTLNMGDGEVIFSSDIQVESSGFVNVQNGDMTVTGDAAFQNNGNLNLESGSVNITGDASLQNGGEMNLNSGNMNVGGSASITNGGTMNSGNSTITLEGDLTIQSTGNFNADSSTVVFSGDSDQTVNIDDGDIVFYNVVVDSGAVFQSDGSNENTIVIENDLTVNEGAAVVIQDDDQIDVQGSLEDEGESVVIDRPFIRFITTPDLNTIVLEYDKDIEESPAENISNYIINNGIVVQNAVLDPNNARLVTLTVTTLTEDLEYELIADNQIGTNGFEMLNGHIKRFGADTMVNFYSRKSGNWTSNGTWSTKQYNGSAAAQNPSNTPNATVNIDSAHVITIESTADLTNLGNVVVDGQGKLIIANGGKLFTGNKIITGSGSFEFISGTLEIGHAEGLTLSGATGAIQTENRTFGSNATYIFNGSLAQSTGNGLPTSVDTLVVNNPVSVTLTGNLETTNQLNLDNGALIIPSGKNLIANNKIINNGYLIAERNISGTKGWRQIASPLSSTYQDLFDNTITQGYNGAYYSTGSNPGDTLQPNVLYYDETWPGTDNQRWRAPQNASDNLTPGRGIYTYFFGDVSGDPLYNIDLPLTLSVQGQENEGDGTTVDFNVTYTTEADSGWNLVGNPFAATIDWDNTNEWVKTNIDNTIYIWDPGANSYKTWNGVTGDLESGLISPFQGFWVKANAEEPVLQVNKTAKTFGNTFVGKQSTHAEQTPHISLTLSDGKQSVATHLMFSEAASIGKDGYDAYRLVPPPGIGTFVDMATIGRNGDVLSINNLPRRFGRLIEIPIYIDAFKNGVSVGSELEISWDTSTLPPGWAITLSDNYTKAKLAVDQSERYSFTNKPSDSIAPNVSGQSKSSAKKPRFTLTIDPGKDANNLPSDFRLEQNYPNPFNPTTKIQFELPIQSMVDLSVFDMLGRHIMTIVNGELSAGEHIYEWNANNLASGIYLYRLATPEFVITKKMTLIK